MISWLNQRLKNHYDGTRDFGGRIVVALGDFFQIKPTNGGFIPEAAMNPKKFSVANKKDELIGGQLWRGVVRLRFAIQQRAKCPVQAARLAKIRANYKIDMEVLNGIRTLSAVDMQDALWYEHHSLHSTNAARHRYGLEGLKRFAARHGQVVLSWKARLTQNMRLTHNSAAGGIRAMFERTPELWEHFVAEAPCMRRLLERVHASRKL
jgi:hypothetical protein